MKNYEDQTILTAIAGSAADVALAAGVVSITGLVPFVWKDVVRVLKKSYSAGVLSEKTYALGDLTMLANTRYEMVVSFRGDRSKEDRKYIVWSTDTAFTAATLVDALVAAVNADTEGDVTAVDDTNNIQLTLDALTNGDFAVRFRRGEVFEDVGETIDTAFVATQGTPTLVTEETGIAVDSAAQYTRYEVETMIPHRTQTVNGSLVQRSVTYGIYLNEVDATDFAAFVVAMDAIIAGTATAATYLGKPTS